MATSLGGTLNFSFGIPVSSCEAAQAQRHQGRENQFSPRPPISVFPESATLVIIMFAGAASLPDWTPQEPNWSL